MALSNVQTPYGSISRRGLARLQASFCSPCILDILRTVETIADRVHGPEAGLRHQLLALHAMAHIVIDGGAAGLSQKWSFAPLAEELCSEFGRYVKEFEQAFLLLNELALRLRPEDDEGNSGPARDVADGDAAPED